MPRASASNNGKRYWVRSMMACTAAVGVVVPVMLSSVEHAARASAGAASAVADRRARRLFIGRLLCVSCVGDSLAERLYDSHGHSSNKDDPSSGGGGHLSG